MVKSSDADKGAVLLAADNVVGTDESEIMVTEGPNMLYEYNHTQGANSLKETTIQLIGKQVTDKDGIRIGTVNSVEIDSITLKLTSVTVENCGGLMTFQHDGFYIENDGLVIGPKDIKMGEGTPHMEIGEELGICQCGNKSETVSETQEIKLKVDNPAANLETVKQKLTDLSDRIIKAVDYGNAKNKDELAALIAELNDLEKELKDTSTSAASQIMEAETKKEEKKKEITDNKQTKAIKKLTFSSLFFSKDDEGKLNALDDCFPEESIELKYPKGYEKSQKRKAEKNENPLKKTIVSQILGGLLFAGLYYLMNILNLI